jgi:hypothetical protein
MCDLWALSEGAPAGFSIHAMTSEIDGGRILARVQVSDGSERDYAAYLACSARREVRALCDVLARVEREDGVAGRPNRAARDIVSRRTPSRGELRAFAGLGVLL